MTIFGDMRDAVIMDDVTTPVEMTDELRAKLKSWYRDDKEGNVYKVKTEETFERTYSYDPGGTLLGMENPDITDKLVRKAVTENPRLLLDGEGKPTDKKEEHITEIWRDDVRVYPRKVRGSE